MNNKLTKLAAAEALVPTEVQIEASPVADPKQRIGTFIVINTPGIKGLRLNLDKIRTYAKAGTDLNCVQIAYDNGGGTTLSFNNEKDANTMLDIIDSYCL